MGIRKLFWSTVGLGAGALLYGALVEVHRLRVDRKTLRLSGWPSRLNGYRIAFMSDFHLYDTGTVDLASRAVHAALDAEPDMVVLGGDFISRWLDHSEEMLMKALAPLSMMNGEVVAIPGNRDYLDGDPTHLDPVFDTLNIRLLRNEIWHHRGINWAGIDSANANQADPYETLLQLNNPDPIIALWHEPDMVDWLPHGCVLMLSGHSHGGQFTTPWGWAPVRSRNGEKYLRGYFPHAPTPLYVSRGLGTTGPPSRLFCPPEVTILTLHSA